MEDFPYVVHPTKRESIAFGSRIPRDKYVFKQRGSLLIAGEKSSEVPSPHATASAFYLIQSQVTSKKGTGGLARSTPRFKSIYTVGPDPATYDVPPYSKSRKCRKPFNAATPRYSYVENINPGPGTYNIKVPRNRRIAMHYSFGGRKTLQPAVHIKCAVINEDKCAICKNSQTGDYWQHKNTTLCRQCMDEEMTSKKIFSDKQLRQFKKIRDCSSIHRHEGTTAAVIIMDGKSLRKLQQKEAYLQQYFP